MISTIIRALLLFLAGGGGGVAGGGGGTGEAGGGGGGIDMADPWMVGYLTSVNSVPRSGSGLQTPFAALMMPMIISTKRPRQTKGATTNQMMNPINGIRPMITIGIQITKQTKNRIRPWLQ